MIFQSRGFLFQGANVTTIKSIGGPNDMLGGAIQNGETPAAALSRMVAAQCGVTIPEEEWLPFGVEIWDDARVHLFVARLPEGQDPRTMDEAHPVTLTNYLDPPGPGWPARLHDLSRAAFDVMIGYRHLYLSIDRSSAAATRSVADLRATELAMRETRMVTIGDVTRSVQPNTEGHWVPAQEAQSLATVQLPEKLYPEGIVYIAGDPVAKLELVDSPERYAWTTGAAVQIASEMTRERSTAPLMDEDDFVEEMIAAEEEVSPGFAARVDAAMARRAQPFLLDMSRYQRSTFRELAPDDDGRPMAEATCWTDWKALASDLEAAGMPDDLVSAFRDLDHIARPNFLSDDGSYAPLGEEHRHACKIVLKADEGLPAFGALIVRTCGSRGHSEPREIRLNFGAHFRLAAQLGEDARPMLAQTLAHELIHVCQEFVGAMFTEADVHAAIARATGMEEIGEVNEDEEQERSQEIQEQYALQQGAEMLSIALGLDIAEDSTVGLEDVAGWMKMAARRLVERDGLPSSQVLRARWAEQCELDITPPTTASRAGPKPMEGRDYSDTPGPATIRQGGEKATTDDPTL